MVWHVAVAAEEQRFLRHRYAHLGPKFRVAKAQQSVGLLGIVALSHDDLTI